MRVHHDEYTPGLVCKSWITADGKLRKCRRPRGHLLEHQGFGWKWWIDTNGIQRKCEIKEIPLEDELLAEVVPELHSLVDETNVLILQMSGVDGYDTVNCDEVKAAIRIQQRRLKEVQKKIPGK